MGTSVGSFLEASLPGIPATILKYMFSTRRVRQGHNKNTAQFVVWDTPVSGEPVRVMVSLPPESMLQVASQEMRLDVVHEDDEVIVVNKVMSLLYDGSFELRF